MTSSKNRVSLAGSERTALPGARMVGAADPNERMEVTVLLRHRTSPENLTSMVKGMSTSSPNKRTYLEREEFAAMHGADPDDIDKVKEFAREHGLDIVEANEAQRRVVLSGTVAAMSEAFGVNLEQYESPMGKYRGRKGPIHPPEDIASIIEGVFGLDNRPQARPHMRPLRDKWRNAEAAAIRPLAGERDISYTPPQLAQLYGFPKGIDGSGQCIGIIELDGGYRSTDLKTYFTKIGITKPPEISSVSVDKASNKPKGNPNSADGEVMLDIEVAGAVAPGAKVVVYFAPNTDRGFLDAVITAIHDTTNKPSVISISWGGPESFWTPQAMQAMDDAFKDAAALGVTVCCAAGDDGSSDIRPPSEDDGLLHVDFPSSSPYVLACGGTRLEGSGSNISNEVVWNEGRESGATGGGVSDVFDIPDWQSNANVPQSASTAGRIGRGVPDVAGDADPRTGYQVLVDGQWGIIGGTSAVAPLWAGLIALLNQELSNPIGYLNPVIYKLSADTEAFRDIATGNNDISGSNGAYQAGPGWDACTGLGSPNGEKLLSALSEG